MLMNEIFKFMVIWIFEENLLKNHLKSVFYDQLLNFDIYPVEREVSKVTHKTETT